MSKQKISNDNPLIEQLYQVLLEEVAACDYLAETLAEKQEAIVKNDLHKINTLTGTEQLIVNKTNLLVQTRKEMIGDIFQKEGILTIPYTLSEFIDHLQDLSMFSWKRIQTRLENTITKINRLNEENITLLNASVSFVRDMIQLFYPQDENNSGVYTKEGLEMDKVGSKNIVDCNI